MGKSVKQGGINLTFGSYFPAIEWLLQGLIKLPLALASGWLEILRALA